MKTRLVLLTLCLFATAVGDAQTATTRELWMWKDANGVTHYSDVPGPGAKKIEIVGSAPASATAPKPAAGKSPSPAPAASVRYTKLEIVSPEEGASFFGADVTVNVSIYSEPSVSGDDRLLLYLDGKLVEGGPATTGYSLSNLERGVHSLTALTLDATGKEKIRSEPRTFNVQQASVRNPANQGPAVRPPQRPTPH